MQANFLGLSPELSALDSAQVVVLPISYECSTTYVKGTAHGPEAIIQASQNLELYDEELGLEPYRVGIATVDPLAFRFQSPEEDLGHIRRACSGLLEKGKFVVALGGEHTVTIGLVAAHLEKYPALQVLQLDAHADLRQQYLGSKYNHACTMARINELCPSLGVGIRSLSVEEAEAIQKDSRRVFFAHQMRSDPCWQERIIDRLGEPVYVTLDLDFFDPAIMPSVGTPEPGGFLWYETLSFLKILAGARTVVGIDIVELCPQLGRVDPDFLAAKLAYKIIGYLAGQKAQQTPVRSKGTGI